MTSSAEREYDMFNTKMANLEGIWFRVEPYPEEKVKEKGPQCLKKGIAYRYEIGITKGLFPFRGFTDESFSYGKSPVGIWVKKLSSSRTKMILVRPRTAKEADAYSLSQETDLVAATLNYEYTEDQFMDNTMTLSDIGGDTYLPPIHSDDDPLNMLMKVAIREKDAPFEPYGKRLDALAVDRTKGIEGNNIRGNTRRGLRDNRAMSPTKFMQYASTWQLEPVFAVRNMPGAMHPLDIPDDGVLAIYPNGRPFRIDPDKVIDISDLIAEAIANSADVEKK